MKRPRAKAPAAPPDHRMTVGALIEQLREWPPDRRVLVITADDSESGVIGDDATVLSVGGGPDQSLLVITIG